MAHHQSRTKSNNRSFQFDFTASIHGCTTYEVANIEGDKTSVVKSKRLIDHESPM